MLPRKRVSTLWRRRERLQDLRLSWRSARRWLTSRLSSSELWRTTKSRCSISRLLRLKTKPTDSLPSKRRRRLTCRPQSRRADSCRFWERNKRLKQPNWKRRNSLSSGKREMKSCNWQRSRRRRRELRDRSNWLSSNRNSWPNRMPRRCLSSSKSRLRPSRLRPSWSSKRRTSTLMRRRQSLSGKALAKM